MNKLSVVESKMLEDSWMVAMLKVLCVRFICIAYIIFDKIQIYFGISILDFKPLVNL